MLWGVLIKAIAAAAFFTVYYLMFSYINSLLEIRYFAMDIRPMHLMRFAIQREQIAKAGGIEAWFHMLKDCGRAMEALDEAVLLLAVGMTAAFPIIVRPSEYYFSLAIAGGVGLSLSSRTRLRSIGIIGSLAQISLNNLNSLSDSYSAIESSSDIDVDKLLNDAETVIHMAVHAHNRVYYEVEKMFIVSYLICLISVLLVLFA